MPEDLRYDSGFYGTVTSNTAPNLPLKGALADWQNEILRLWVANIGRTANDTDILLFRGLLDAKEEAITMQLTYHRHGVSHFHGPETGTVMDHMMWLPSLKEEPLPSQEPQTALQVADDVSDVFTNTEAFVGPDKGLNHDDALLALPLPLNHDPNFDIYAPGPSRSNFAGPSDFHFPPMSDIQDMPAAQNSCFNKLPHANGCIKGKAPMNLSASSENIAARALFQPHHSMNRALRKKIESFITEQALKGCGPIRAHEVQAGRFICTIGCGRRFRTAADARRHEEIVYPQNFWICTQCGDPAHSLKGCFFLREDKLRQHIRNKGHTNISLDRCRVLGIQAKFPVRCWLCSHGHHSWEDRNMHFKWHYKKGHFAALTQNAHISQIQAIPGAGEDDDDDGGDDDDDGDNHENEDEGYELREDGPDDDNGNGNGGSNSDGPSSQDHDRNDDGNDQGIGDPDGEDQEDLWGRFLNDYSGFRGYPSSVRIVPLPFLSAHQQHDPPKQLSTIQWLERLKKQGGTASMFKVRMPSLLEGSSVSQTQPFIIKQYESRHFSLFEREVEAFTFLQAQTNAPTSIMHCYGTFEYVDCFGQRRHNLVLQCGECDLRDYWISHPRPQATDEIEDFWHSMSNIAEALHKLHEPQTYRGKSVYGVHADVKPENIIYVGGAFKLADFGFTVIFDVDHTASIEQHTEWGGTPKYGMFALCLAQRDILLTSHQLHLKHPTANVSKFVHQQGKATYGRLRASSPKQ